MVIVHYDNVLFAIHNKNLIIDKKHTYHMMMISDYVYGITKDKFIKCRNLNVDSKNLEDFMNIVRNYDK